MRVTAASRAATRLRSNVSDPRSAVIDTLVGLLGVLVLIALNAFFVAAEFALVAVDRAEVDARVAAGDRAFAVAAGLLDRLSFHLSAIQLGITITSVVLGLVAEPTVAELLEPVLDPLFGSSGGAGVSVVLALLLATMAQMILGELVPKAVAIALPLATARRLARPTLLYSTLLHPITVVIGALADRLVRLMGVEPTEELTRVRSRYELARVVDRSVEDGTLNVEGAALVSRTFRFHEKTAADALTPRTDVVALAADATASDLVELSLSTGKSRFPVFREGLDDIVGVVAVSSIFSLAEDERSTASVAAMAAEPWVVPESKDLDDLLAEGRATRRSMAIVLDEYGGTAGLITMEDLVEELVGEIDDEHDLAGTRTPVWRWGGATVLAGRLHLDEVEEASGLVLPDGDYETLAGFVLERLGRIPTGGETVEYDGWTLEVREMDGRRIASVRCVAPEVPADAGGEAD